MKNQIPPTIGIIIIFIVIAAAMGFRPAGGTAKQYVYVRGVEGANSFPKLRKLLVNYPDGKTEEIKLEATIVDNIGTINAELNKLSKEGYELVTATSNLDNGMYYTTFVLSK